MQRACRRASMRCSPPWRRRPSRWAGACATRSGDARPGTSCPRRSSAEVVRGKAAAAVYNGLVTARLATSSAERNNVVQTVDRALQMLAAFTADGQQLRGTDFTALLGGHKRTASRLL